MLAAQMEGQSINSASLAIGLLLWSTRLTKQSGHGSKAEFMAQCSNIWDAGLAEISDDELRALVLAEDLEKEGKPNDGQ